MNEPTVIEENEFKVEWIRCNDSFVAQICNFRQKSERNEMLLFLCKTAATLINNYCLFVDAIAILIN